MALIPVSGICVRHHQNPCFWSIWWPPLVVFVVVCMCVSVCVFVNFIDWKKKSSPETTVEMHGVSVWPGLSEKPKLLPVLSPLQCPSLVVYRLCPGKGNSCPRLHTCASYVGVGRGGGPGILLL